MLEINLILQSHNNTMALGKPPSEYCLIIEHQLQYYYRLLIAFVKMPYC